MLQHEAIKNIHQELIVAGNDPDSLKNSEEFRKLIKHTNQVI